MNEQDRKKMIIRKDHEQRTKGISKMISEGGLGSETYYDIEKPEHPTKENIEKWKDET